MVTEFNCQHFAAICSHSPYIETYTIVYIILIILFTQLHAAKLLLRHGATVDIKDDFGFSPLFLATGLQTFYWVITFYTPKCFIVYGCPFVHLSVFCITSTYVQCILLKLSHITKNYWVIVSILTNSFAELQELGKLFV